MSRILEKLADQHEERIINVLYKLEEDIIKEVNRATKGQLVSQRIAIQLQPKIRQAIENNFLNEADLIINEEYNKIAKEVLDTFGELPIPNKFKSLTEVNLSTINALKFQSYSGFEDIGERFIKVINDELYQSTIAGRPYEDMVSNIRSHINGVYKKSNQKEINELVDFINENKYDKFKKSQVEEAVRKLHTQYASDRAGNNLRRYAGQIAHDSVMQFHGQFTIAKAKESGLTHFTYTGTLVRDSRDWCRGILGKTYTEKQIRELWNTRSWNGKANGDPFIVRGGYRCRHTWIPTDPAWGEETLDELPPEEDIEETTPEVSQNLASVVTAPKRKFGKYKGLTDEQVKNVVDKDLKSQLTPTTLKVFNNIPLVNAITLNQKKAYFRPSEDTLVTNTKAGTLAHEYGHYIDYKTGSRKIGQFEVQPKPWSFENKKFREAFEKDAKNFTADATKGSNKLQKYFDELVEIRYYEKTVRGKRRKTGYYEGKLEGDNRITDIIDALVNGRFHSLYKAPGHGLNYYRKVELRMTETFANLFAVQKNKRALNILKDIVPNTMKQFDERIKELAK